MLQNHYNIRVDVAVNHYLLEAPLGPCFKEKLQIQPPRIAARRSALRRLLRGMCVNTHPCLAACRSRRPGRYARLRGPHQPSPPCDCALFLCALLLESLCPMRTPRVIAAQNKVWRVCFRCKSCIVSLRGAKNLGIILDLIMLNRTTPLLLLSYACIGWWPTTCCPRVVVPSVGLRRRGACGAAAPHHQDTTQRGRARVRHVALPLPCPARSRPAVTRCDARGAVWLSLSLLVLVRVRVRVLVLVLGGAGVICTSARHCCTTATIRSSPSSASTAAARSRPGNEQTEGGRREGSFAA